MPLHLNWITEGFQLRTHCALLAPLGRLYLREGSEMKKSTACMLAGIAAATMGITACASGSATTTMAASAPASVPTSYLDKNGYPCAPAQASGGYCPEDPASTPYSQPAEGQPSSGTSSTVAASSAPAPARTHRAHRAHPAASTPAPASSTPSGCYPLSNEGTCYEPGEYCRNSDHGASGVAGDGKSIICEDNDGWRWEPA